MPVPTLKKQADGSLEVVKPRDDIAPIFIWESSRFLLDATNMWKDGLGWRNELGRTKGVTGVLVGYDS